MARYRQKFTPECVDSWWEALDDYPETMRFLWAVINHYNCGDIEDAVDTFKRNFGLKHFSHNDFEFLMSGRLPAHIDTRLNLDTIPSNRWNPEREAMHEFIAEKLCEVLSETFRSPCSEKERERWKVLRRLWIAFLKL